MKEREGGIKREKGEEKERGKRCKKYERLIDERRWGTIVECIPYIYMCSVYTYIE